MGYGVEMAPPPPMRRPDGSEIEQPGNDRRWWETRLATATDVGLTDIELRSTTPGQARFWGVTGLHEGRIVAARLPRFLERRGGDDISDEVMVTVAARALPVPLGIWVIESPAKWFRGRRAWALNRPTFTTGEPSFDADMVSWAWDCSEGPDALRAALGPILPTIRSILETQPGATVTDSGIGTWIPLSESDGRLPSLLTSASKLAGRSDS
ncbi:MAG: hypothetical protein WCC01_12430 [Acidimicrobiia bacterium]